MMHTAARRGDRRWLGFLGLCALGGALLAGAAALRPALGPDTLELRVIGSSNRPADQALKLQVRDAVLAALGPGLAGPRSPAAAQSYVRARLGAVQQAAAAVAAPSGETVRTQLGAADLPARRLGLLAFPAGRAPALVITVGAGRGHNWWTVLFPPLALVTIGGDLVVVGPAGASEPVRDLDPAERQALLDWVSGRTGLALAAGVQAAGPDGTAGAKVQVRFLVWDLARGVSWNAVRGTITALLQRG